MDTPPPQRPSPRMGAATHHHVVAGHQRRVGGVLWAGACGRRVRQAWAGVCGRRAGWECGHDGRANVPAARPCTAHALQGAAVKQGRPRSTQQPAACGAPAAPWSACARLHGGTLRLAQALRRQLGAIQPHPLGPGGGAVLRGAGRGRSMGGLASAGWRAIRAPATFFMFFPHTQPYPTVPLCPPHCQPPDRRNPRQPALASASGPRAALSAGGRPWLAVSSPAGCAGTPLSARNVLV